LLWELSRISFRKEFAEGQKAFATAAFRRAREIEGATNRLISRASNRGPEASLELRNELDVILAIASGIQQAVRFSTADWADVIGDEIATIQKIEELTSEEEALRKSPDEEKVASTFQETAQSTLMSNHLMAVEKQLEELRASLPPAFRVLARNGPSDDEKRLEACKNKLSAELKETGCIQLDGFWEENAGFAQSITDFHEGEVLDVQIGDAGNRTAAFLLLGGTSAPIGVIMNAVSKKSAKYQTFVEALCKVLNRSRSPQ
jgi:hypothetical protein